MHLSFQEGCGEPPQPTGGPPVLPSYTRPSGHSLRLQLDVDFDELKDVVPRDDADDLAGVEHRQPALAGAEQTAHRRCRRLPREDAEHVRAPLRDHIARAREWPFLTRHLAQMLEPQQPAEVSLVV